MTLVSPQEKAVIGVDAEFLMFSGSSNLIVPSAVHDKIKSEGLLARLVMKERLEKVCEESAN